MSAILVRLDNTTTHLKDSAQAAQALLLAAPTTRSADFLAFAVAKADTPLILSMESAIRLAQLDSTMMPLNSFAHLALLVLLAAVSRMEF